MNSQKICVKLVGLAWLEQATSPLSGVRSNQNWATDPVVTYIGGASRDRTDDLLRARQTLSQLSYDPGRISLNIFQTICESTPKRVAEDQDFL